MPKFIYKARKSNSTMKYTKDEKYHGQFVTEGHSKLLLITNDTGDSVLVYKNDFDYVRKIDVK
ncbi:hypothetical protein [Clostridium tagluense]|uniref:Uncharacterized protein n=1 Tax=Clostridium tagluense TaxID=360422 RepID=A0A401UTL1_9CLOT|nr:hypothetical protein [Clostridium tagluense]GCD12883.1 hypothetical protein Ctaglu_45060 [Clostridium tagluense]